MVSDMIHGSRNESSSTSEFHGNMSKSHNKGKVWRVDEYNYSFISIINIH